MSSHDLSTDALALLPDVTLEVRQGTGRSASYPLGTLDFLIGTVPGCDLRLAGSDSPAVLCLLARHAQGIAIRKLAPTQTILVNGRSVSSMELAHGDRITIGGVEITLQVHASTVVSTTHAKLASQLEATQRELQDKINTFRAQVVQFQREKESFQRERDQLQQQNEAARRDQAANLEAERQRLLGDLLRRDQASQQQASDLERDKQETARLRQELAEQRRQLFDSHQERRDRLMAMQEEIDKTALALQEREKKLTQDEVHAVRLREQDIERHTELTRLVEQLTAERSAFDLARAGWKTEIDAREADLRDREEALTRSRLDLDAKLRQYQTDILRLDRQQGSLEVRETAVRQQADEIAEKQQRLNHDSAELEEQVRQLDELRLQLSDESERLKLQRQEQDAQVHQLNQRAAILDGQQTTFAGLRSRLERTREEIRAQELQLDEQRAQLAARADEIEQRGLNVQRLEAEIDGERRLHEQERVKWAERGAVMESAVKQLKETQAKFAAEEERLRRHAQELEERGKQLLEQEGIFQGRLSHLVEAQERLDAERQSLRDRAASVIQSEQAREALQEQLRNRAMELESRQKWLHEQFAEHEPKFAAFAEERARFEQEQHEATQRLDALRLALDDRAAKLDAQHAELSGFEQKYHDQLAYVAQQRKSLADERVQFQITQQAALEKHAADRAEFDALRLEAAGLAQQMPDMELRVSASLERLKHAREQVRDHLGEIHQYVRSNQDDLEKLRGKLQAEVELMQQQEQGLRRNQDEHRLAMVAFRQQLIDWQGQIAEMKRQLSRDGTRLERKQAQVEEQARKVDATSQQLAKQAEELHEQQREVADRRQEMDSHLVEMREWYRRKLRDLAGIPMSAGAELDAPPMLHEAVTEATGEDGEPGIVPTSRSILALSGPIDHGDQQLGEVLRDLQLIDADTLTALLAESRRQRRSLRQVLLTSGAVTLYQLAIIEAGNVHALMLGPVRVIDRIRTTPHETIYRVFDPRRGSEAVLRHLGDADMADALRPDEFRQRFSQAILSDPHLVHTLEVFDLHGRPAVLQEWATGLPATDWPPLAAAPGVCFRLLTQAALGLAAAHQTGLVHGHLREGLLLLTGDGVLKISGLGEPPWLVGSSDEDADFREDLKSLGRIVSGWCTPTGVRRGARTKPLPDGLVSVLYRLAGDGDAGYRDARELLDDLEKASSDVPPNSEAWDRLLKYVREHGGAEILLRQSA
jgi:chromosome segregation ATPase